MLFNNVITDSYPYPLNNLHFFIVKLFRLQLFKSIGNGIYILYTLANLTYKMLSSEIQIISLIRVIVSISNIR